MPINKLRQNYKPMLQQPENTVSYVVRSTEDKKRNPYLFWEGETNNNTLFRLVVVYNVVGELPRVVMEKSAPGDLTALGERKWQEVDVKILPIEFWRDVVRIFNGLEEGDNSIME